MGTGKVYECDVCGSSAIEMRALTTPEGWVGLNYQSRTSWKSWQFCSLGCLDQFLAVGTMKELKV